MSGLEAEKETQVPKDEKSMEQSLLNFAITDENRALTAIVGFVNLAQRRGAFSIPESSKVWECIQKFQKSAN